MNGSPVNVRTLDNGVLWHIVFAPFVDHYDELSMLANYREDKRLEED